MLRFPLLIVFLLSASCAYAQRDSAASRAPRHLVYAEGGGNGFVYSLNYAHVWRDPTGSPCLRAGICFNPGYDKAVMVPLEATMLIGRQRHFFEFGVGATGFTRMVKPHMGVGGSYLETWQRTKGVIFTGRLGYCFLPANPGKAMFRVGYTPLLFPGSYYYDESFDNPEFLPLWGGLSVGFAF